MKLVSVLKQLLGFLRVLICSEFNVDIVTREFIRCVDGKMTSDYRIVVKFYLQSA